MTLLRLCFVSSSSSSMKRTRLGQLDRMDAVSAITSISHLVPSMSLWARLPNLSEQLAVTSEVTGNLSTDYVFTVIRGHTPKQ
jgi:hypothetical protein